MAQKANPRLSLANVEGLHGNALVSLCRVHLDRAGMLKACGSRGCHPITQDDRALQHRI